MATILFFVLPELGHMNSTFKMARQLIAKGHRVSYAQIPDLEKHIKSQGIDFIPFLTTIFPAGFLKQQQTTDLEAILLQRATSSNLDQNTFGREFAAVVHQVRPDLLVLDFLMPNIELIVAAVKQLEVPFVLFRNILSVTPEYAVFEARHNLIVPCPEEFDFPHSTPPAHHHYVEPSIDLERHESPFDWNKIGRDKQIIYCSLGTQSHLFDGGLELRQKIIEAIATKPEWQLILSMGSQQNIDELGSLPSNVLPLAMAPQLEILSRAGLMITHGGLNTVKECIFFGVPMIVFPLGRDQYLNAARVEYHHLGVRATHTNVSAAEISSLIETVAADTSLRQSLQEMKNLFREREEQQLSVKVIESILKGVRQLHTHRQLVG